MARIYPYLPYLSTTFGQWLNLLIGSIFAVQNGGNLKGTALYFFSNLKYNSESQLSRAVHGCCAELF